MAGLSEAFLPFSDCRDYLCDVVAMSGTNERRIGEFDREDRSTVAKRGHLSSLCPCAKLEAFACPLCSLKHACFSLLARTIADYLDVPLLGESDTLGVESETTGRRRGVIREYRKPLWAMCLARERNLMLHN